VKVRSFFVTNSQAPKLIQPSEGSLHHPAPSTQSATVFRITLREKRDDASVTQTLPDRFGIIATVA
jgi:hypothetical protein